MIFSLKMEDKWIDKGKLSYFIMQVWMELRGITFKGLRNISGQSEGNGFALR